MNSKELKIRKEKTKDFRAVFTLIREAFKNEQYSDHKEQFLVERLRKSSAFIPELSIVAVNDNKIVGHILLTKLKIISDKNVFHSLALAPVSVSTEYQGKGVGGKLINQAHKMAKELGYKSIVLLGHEKYYPRFGYEQAAKYGIKLPFEVPKENCMAIELVENGLNGVNGMVEYPKEFNE
ncbi:N-acetyltransferase [Labilibaculum sp. DW002]|uniref:N-acetyltransferase n=1 Tax=Paralabilibaculum antarcticum TaxID=2912572 RepID=A0ABT5VW26_9BACT|nr:N-acetyltransferase [Labilibaculum sp. DW002]MDE5419602.1 N-acetyltransferase [Labilibaculum sp. DW002]